MLPVEYKPRPPRHGVLLMAAVERFGGVDASLHRVRNLSAAGACVDHADELAAGATVVITVGNVIAAAASVKWAHDGLAGLQFGEPIMLEDALVRAVKPPENSSASKRLHLKV